MPPNTEVPTARRVSAAAPLAITRGRRPSTNARLVITTGRMRIRAPAIAASSTEAPAACRSIANSTIRIAFLLATAISTTCRSGRTDRSGHGRSVRRHAGAVSFGFGARAAPRAGCPALVEADQEQIREHCGDSEDVERPAGGRLLLQRGAGPFAAEVWR